MAAAAATASPGSIRPSLGEKLAMFRGVSCILCPVQLGAFAQCADTGRWCHVACARWTPEIAVAEIPTDDGDSSPRREYTPRVVTGVSAVPKERAKRACVACGRVAGVTMRCSFGHCQTTFHALCARTTPGFHFRASDGQKPQFRAYCDAHGEQQRVRDLQRGVPPAVVPPPPEMAPVTMAPGSGRRDAHADARLAAAAKAAAAADPRAAGMRAEDADALRRIRADLLRARGVCKAVLRRESVKRGIARADAALRAATLGMGNKADGGGDGGGPRGGETREKRARSGSRGPEGGRGEGSTGEGHPKRARRTRSEAEAEERGGGEAGEATSPEPRAR